MIPTAFLLLDHLPLTLNGKLDRKALPAPDLLSTSSNPSFAPPRSPVEQVLVATWCELLSLDQLGIHDNFFALGGHSLLATRLISRLRLLFQIELPLRAVFDDPTVAGLAQHVEAALYAEAGLSAPAISVVSREQALPLSFAQERLWFLDQLIPDSAAYNVPLA
jgi:Phosphopantetheine attachment site.